MDLKNSFKKVLVAAMVLVLLPGLVMFAASQKPNVKKGAKVTIANGTLIQWKDLKKKVFDQNTARKMKPILNFEDPTKIVKRTNEKDPVVQSSHYRAFGQESRFMTTPIKNFAGLNFMEHGSGWPPDTTGDVGINHYVQAVNSAIGIYKKSTGEFLGSITFDDWFPASVDPTCDANNNGDPIVLFDQIRQRWFILDFAWIGTTNGSYFSIAASQTADPTGAWWLYCFQANATLMDDYPKCGVWHDGIYITANMFAFGGSYQYTQIWALKAPELYTGTLTSQTVNVSSLRSFTIMPACAKGKVPPPSSAPNYMYSIDANEFGGAHTDSLHVWQYRVNWNRPSDTTFTGPVILPVAPYDLSASRVPQRGTTWTLDSLYGRLMAANIYRRNLSPDTGSYEAIYLSHTAEYMGHRAVRWYELRIVGGVSTVYQQGTYSPDANHRWMGSVCADKNGNIAIGYSTASTLMYPAIQYAGRLASDPRGIMAQGEKTIIAGTGSQTRISRWGDYSMMSIDPVDDETFWYTQEYYLTSAVAPALPNWQTRIASFKLTPAGQPKNIAEAVDTPEVTFTTAGTGAWAYQTATSYAGGDAAKSPVISHKQQASMSTVVTGKTSVKFFWKVSSEANFDYLKFYIDGVQQAQISGEVNWQLKSFPLTVGQHTLTWTYIKNSSISAGSDCGFVDRLLLENGVDVALDIKGQNFVQTGNRDFEITTSSPSYGTSCIGAPTALNDNESCIVETVVNNKQSVSFYWKASSESGWDYLNFYIDGVLQARISGTVAWTQRTFTLTTGTHRLAWAYVKDSADSGGSDQGWVDRVVIL